MNTGLTIRGRELLPIVQGGMGVGVSAHRLAGTVSSVPVFFPKSASKTFLERSSKLRAQRWLLSRPRGGTSRTGTGL